MTLVKYVFIQNDPFYLPGVLDTYLREFAGSTVGINVQTVAQGRRSVLRTALDLYRMYGFGYFQWKLRRYLLRKVQATVINGLLGSTKTCYSVAAVARKYGVRVTDAVDVNSEGFLRHLRDLGVEFIVSISGTQYYGRTLRDQVTHGIINCHGALLPKYRGLMPSFWTLANGETEGGVTVHLIDAKIDNGPILVQKRYRILQHDTLEQIMARSKNLAAEAILESVRLVEGGRYTLLPNDESEATHFSMPTRQDTLRFRAAGRRFH